MKKNNFLSGLSAKLALAIVTLATTMFTSCEKEDISISVTPVNATAYVNIMVVANNSDVTGAATITPSEGTVTTVNGTYQIKFEGNPTLAKKTITIDASYGGMTGNTSVELPALEAGGTTSVTAKIFLNYSKEDLEIVKDQNVKVETEEVKNPTEEAKEADWTNDTENPITQKFTYIDIEGSKVLSSDYDGYDEAVKNLINAYNKEYTEKKETIEIEIPAYTKKVPVVTTTKSTITYNIVTKTRAAGDKIVTFTVEDYTTKVDAEAVSIGHGHGHDGHGDGGNAGGGITNAD